MCDTCREEGVDFLLRNYHINFDDEANADAEAVRYQVGANADAETVRYQVGAVSPPSDTCFTQNQLPQGSTSPCSSCLPALPHRLMADPCSS